MIIKILLVVCIGILGVWFIKNNSTSKLRASNKIGILVLLIFAVVSVIFPNLTDSLAHAVGVGRGADLLLYAVTITFFAYVLNQYIKGKRDEQKIVRLARKIALMEAELTQNRGKKELKHKKQTRP